MDDEKKKLLDKLNDSIAMGESALWLIAVELFVMTMILVISL